MFVEVTEGQCVVREATDLKGLAVHVADHAHLSALGDLGHVDEGGEHVWLSIAALRDAAAATLPADERATWLDSYDGMIAYAVSKGWASPDAQSVRAHLSRT
jgi:hypothetical protein